MTARSSRLPALVALLIAVLFPTSVTSAPVTESSAVTYWPVADSTGCYYNFQHYDEGDRILTNEPCLNCTCHNRMLMCYLRVCPFVKQIGENCKVEKRPDQCCPVITCPEVPVQLLTSTTESSAVGHIDQYGCSIDGLFYSDGARVPSHPNKPCELCYCIRNKTACVMQECTLNIEGCRPVYQDGACCPVKYDCDHPKYTGPPMIETTMRPTTEADYTTTMIAHTTEVCWYNDEMFADGALVRRDKCEQCYCMKGSLTCAVMECGPTPLDKAKCKALPPKEDQCCTDSYDCDSIIDEDLTTAMYELTTLAVTTPKPDGTTADIILDHHTEIQPIQPSEPQKGVSNEIEEESQTVLAPSQDIEHESEFAPEKQTTEKAQDITGSSILPEEELKVTTYKYTDAQTTTTPQEEEDSNAIPTHTQEVETEKLPVTETTEEVVSKHEDEAEPNHDDSEDSEHKEAEKEQKPLDETTTYKGIPSAESVDDNTVTPHLHEILHTTEPIEKPNENTEPDIHTTEAHEIEHHTHKPTEELESMGHVTEKASPSESATSTDNQSQEQVTDNKFTVQFEVTTHKSDGTTADIISDHHTEIQPSEPQKGVSNEIQEESQTVLAPSQDIGNESEFTSEKQTTEKAQDETGTIIVPEVELKVTTYKYTELSESVTSVQDELSAETTEATEKQEVHTTSFREEHATETTVVTEKQEVHTTDFVEHSAGTSEIAPDEHATPQDEHSTEAGEITKTQEEHTTPIAEEIIHDDQEPSEEHDEHVYTTSSVIDSTEHSTEGKKEQELQTTEAHTTIREDHSTESSLALTTEPQIATDKIDEQKESHDMETTPKQEDISNEGGTVTEHVPKITSTPSVSITSEPVDETQTEETQAYTTGKQVETSTEAVETTSVSHDMEHEPEETGSEQPIEKQELTTQKAQQVTEKSNEDSVEPEMTSGQTTELTEETTKQQVDTEEPEQQIPEETEYKVPQPTEPAVTSEDHTTVSEVALTEVQETSTSHGISEESKIQTTESGNIVVTTELKEQSSIETTAKPTEETTDEQSENVEHDDHEIEDEHVTEPAEAHEKPSTTKEEAVTEHVQETTLRQEIQTDVSVNEATKPHTPIETETRPHAYEETTISHVPTEIKTESHSTDKSESQEEVVIATTEVHLPEVVTEGIAPTVEPMKPDDLLIEKETQTPIEGTQKPQEITEATNVTDQKATEATEDISHDVPEEAEVEDHEPSTEKQHEQEQYDSTTPVVLTPEENTTSKEQATEKEHTPTTIKSEVTTESMQTTQSVYIDGDHKTTVKSDEQTTSVQQEITTEKLEIITQSSGDEGTTAYHKEPTHEEESVTQEEHVDQTTNANVEQYTDTPEHTIPGEGSCLVDGKTYQNNTPVPPINRCQVSCKCVSSILQCESVTCEAAPSHLQNCMPIFTDGCCPTYHCAEPTTTAADIQPTEDHNEAHPSENEIDDELAPPTPVIGVTEPPRTIPGETSDDTHSSATPEAPVTTILPKVSEEEGETTQSVIEPTRRPVSSTEQIPLLHTSETIPERDDTEDNEITSEVEEKPTTSKVIEEATTSHIQVENTSKIQEEQTTIRVEEGVTTSGAQEDLTTIKAQEELTTSKAQEELTTSKAQEELTTSKAQEELTTSKAQEELPTSQEHEEFTTGKVHEEPTTGKAEAAITSSQPEKEEVTSSTVHVDETTIKAQEEQFTTKTTEEMTQPGENEVSTSVPTLDEDKQGVTTEIKETEVEEKTTPRSADDVITTTSSFITTTAPELVTTVVYDDAKHAEYTTTVTSVETTHKSAGEDDGETLVPITPVIKDDTTVPVHHDHSTTESAIEVTTVHEDEKVSTEPVREPTPECENTAEGCKILELPAVICDSKGENCKPIISPEEPVYTSCTGESCKPVETLQPVEESVTEIQESEIVPECTGELCKLPLPPRPTLICDTNGENCTPIPPGEEIALPAVPSICKDGVCRPIEPIPELPEQTDVACLGEECKKETLGCDSSDESCKTSVPEQPVEIPSCEGEACKVSDEEPLQQTPENIPCSDNDVSCTQPQVSQTTDCDGEQCTVPQKLPTEAVTSTPEQEDIPTTKQTEQEPQPEHDAGELEHDLEEQPDCSDGLCLPVIPDKPTETPTECNENDVSCNVPIKADSTTPKSVEESEVLTESHKPLEESVTNQQQEVLTTEAPQEVQEEIIVPVNVKPLCDSDSESCTPSVVQPVDQEKPSEETEKTTTEMDVVTEIVTSVHELQTEDHVTDAPHHEDHIPEEVDELTTESAEHSTKQEITSSNTDEHIEATHSSEQPDDVEHKITTIKPDFDTTKAEVTTAQTSSHTEPNEPVETEDKHVEQTTKIEELLEEITTAQIDTKISNESTDSHEVTSQEPQHITTVAEEQSTSSLIHDHTREEEDSTIMHHTTPLVDKEPTQPEEADIGKEEETTPHKAEDVDQTTSHKPEDIEETTSHEAEDVEKTTPHKAEDVEQTTSYKAEDVDQTTPHKIEDAEQTTPHKTQDDVEQTTAPESHIAIETESHKPDEIYTTPEKVDIADDDLNETEPTEEVPSEEHPDHVSTDVSETEKTTQKSSQTESATDLPKEEHTDAHHQETPSEKVTTEAPEDITQEQPQTTPKDEQEKPVQTTEKSVSEVPTDSLVTTQASEEKQTEKEEVEPTELPVPDVTQEQESETKGESKPTEPSAQETTPEPTKPFKQEQDTSTETPNVETTEAVEKITEKSTVELTETTHKVTEEYHDLHMTEAEPVESTDADEHIVESFSEATEAAVQATQKSTEQNLTEDHTTEAEKIETHTLPQGVTTETIETTEHIDVVTELTEQKPTMIAQDHVFDEQKTTVASVDQTTAHHDVGEEQSTQQPGGTSHENETEVPEVHVEATTKITPLVTEKEEEENTTAHSELSKHTEPELVETTEAAPQTSNKDVDVTTEAEKHEDATENKYEQSTEAQIINEVTTEQKEEQTTKHQEIPVTEANRDQTVEEDGEGPQKSTEAVEPTETPIEEHTSEKEQTSHTAEQPEQPEQEITTAVHKEDVTTTASAENYSDTFTAHPTHPTLPTHPTYPPYPEIAHTTTKVPPSQGLPDHGQEIPDYPSQVDDYEDEEQGSFGPGTCRYGGKIYVSAQQIPRDDPCDFCFCFRSDIICLQQSCPPPIPRCHEEPIRGFCCPRYECPVARATALNITTTTTTTTTTLPPHFLSHAYKGRAYNKGCQISGHTYEIGEVIKSASGPCLHCICGDNGQMQCDPKPCTPEPMLRQMIAAAVSRRRR